MNTYRKFFAALIPLIVFALASAGVALPADWGTGLAAVVAPLLVYKLPK